MEEVMNNVHDKGLDTPQKIRDRDWRIDVLKAFCIVFVILFHCNLLKNGYLAVDVFFAISGFLLMKSFLKAESQGGYRYFKGLIKNIFRLWPLVLIVSFLCVIIGFLTMLPDDFENLGESVVASSLFCGNILSYVTTRNYWNISNNYRPLMHLWYLGVLMQSYIVIPAVFKVSLKIHKNALKIIVVALAFLSLLLYLLPVFSSSLKFYWLPFRLFEILAGSCACLFGIKMSRQRVVNILSIIIFVFLLFIFSFRINLISGSIYLLLTVFLTGLLLFFVGGTNPVSFKWIRPISIIGEASFSIYVIHQPVIAFTRYLFVSSISGLTFLTVILIVFSIAFLSFIFVEKKLGEVILRIRYRFSLLTVMSSFLIVSITGGIVYLKAGVFHDFPELDVYVSNAHRGMHAEYVDIPYSWNKDFDNNGKINILVVGDSMARDWANILNESQYSDTFNISYVSGSSLNSDYDYRFKDAKYVFFATLVDSTSPSGQLSSWKDDPKFYNIGVKNFGESNGQIYQRRYQKNYYNSSIRMGYNSSGILFADQNKKQKEYWGEKYIDMIEPIQNKDGTIPVFTDTHKFISHDTEHLTKNGAIYYSKKLDLSWIK